MICRSNGSESQGCSHLLAHTVPSNSSSRAHSVCQPELVTSPNTIPGLALPPFSTISDLSDPPAIQGTAAGRSRMDHGSSSSKAKRAFRFIQDEVKQMEEKLKPRTTSHPDRVLMRELALKFSESQGRVGTTPVTPKQVHVVVLRIGFSFSGRDPKFLSNLVSIRSAPGNLCCPHAGPQLVSLPPLLQEQQEGSCHESAAAGDGDPSRPAAKGADSDWARPSARCRILLHRL